MSGISSGVGIVSGIDTASLIDQLIAIERRPINQLQTRVDLLDATKAAYVQLTAQILSAQNAATRFRNPTFFSKFSSPSSNESILQASASAGAVPGTYNLKVHSLVSSHAVVSRGFRDRDTTPIGSGTLSIEMGGGRVNPGTNLEDLRGGQGIERGAITITDRRGHSAEIDLTTAVTMRDVVEAINNADGINVRASVTSLSSDGAGGDRLVIEDLNHFAEGTAPASNLIIDDEPGGQTAAHLGISGNSASGRIDGHDLVFLGESTYLSLLNDGNGVGGVRQFSLQPDFEIVSADGSHHFNVSLSDYMDPALRLEALNNGRGVRRGEDGAATVRLTTRSGESVDLDLSGATTVQDVIDTINANDAGITARSFNNQLQLTDNSTPAEDDNAAADNEEADTAAPTFKIEDVSGHLAADLGIAGEVETNTLTGQEIYRIDTIGDALRAINYAPGNEEGFVQARISADGDSIELLVNSFQDYQVHALNDSTAARDLGLEDATFGITGTHESRRLLAGLNSVLLTSLNGGSGVDGNSITVRSRRGVSTDIDLSSAETLQDVVDLINASGTTVQASISATGNSLQLRDSADGEGDIQVEEAGGTTAADLGLLTSNGAITTFDGTLRGGNLQLQYVSRQTKLADLNAGRGINLGRISISDSTGRSTSIQLPANLQTVGELIDQLNLEAPDSDEDGVGNFHAQINPSGDGIVIIDQAGGTQTLTIRDESGSSAADLRIAGTADTGSDRIDGSYEINIDVGATDTLENIVTKLNEAEGSFTASILQNTGSQNPFSLSINSRVSGRGGELIIDTGALDLGLSTLTRARDAVVTIGSEGSPLLITSASNTLTGVIPGLTIDLLSASKEEVTVNVSQDIDGIVEDVQTFVDAFNDAQSSINSATRFDQETLERGPLLGDATVNRVRDRMNRTVGQSYNTGGAITRLSSIGIRLGPNNQINFDEAKFRQAYEQSPGAVEKLFTDEANGLGTVLSNMFDGLTGEFDGVITRRDELLDNQKELLNDRIASQEVLLDAKRARLETQFLGLETALAGLQDQQTALNQLSSLA